MDGDEKVGRFDTILGYAFKSLVCSVAISSLLWLIAWIWVHMPW